MISTFPYSPFTPYSICKFFEIFTYIIYGTTSNSLNKTRPVFGATGVTAWCGYPICWAYAGCGAPSSGGRIWCGGLGDGVRVWSRKLWNHSPFDDFVFFFFGIFEDCNYSGLIISESRTLTNNQAFVGKFVPVDRLVWFSSVTIEHGSCGWVWMLRGCLQFDLPKGPKNQKNSFQHRRGWWSEKWTNQRIKMKGSSSWQFCWWPFFGMVKRDPFQWLSDLQRLGMKRSRLESPKGWTLPTIMRFKGRAVTWSMVLFLFFHHFDLPRPLKCHLSNEAAPPRFFKVTSFGPRSDFSGLKWPLFVVSKGHFEEAGGCLGYIGEQWKKHEKTDSYKKQNSISWKVSGRFFFWWLHFRLQAQSSTLAHLPVLIRVGSEDRPRFWWDNKVGYLEDHPSYPHF